MTISEPRQRPPWPRDDGRFRRQILITLPLMSLLLCLILLNRLPGMGNPSPTGDNLPTTTAMAAQLSVTPISTVTPTPTPTPTATGDAATPTPWPTLPAAAQVVIIGPPEAARFTLEDEVAFYWQWPLPPTEDTLFTLFATLEGVEYRLGSVTAPNLGLSYRFQTTLGHITTTAVPLTWYVRLETSDGTTLLTSEPRSLMLISTP